MFAVHHLRFPQPILFPLNSIPPVDVLVMCFCILPALIRLTAALQIVIHSTLLEA